MLSVGMVRSPFHPVCPQELSLTIPTPSAQTAILWGCRGARPWSPLNDVTPIAWTLWNHFLGLYVEATGAPAKGSHPTQLFLRVEIQRSEYYELHK